LRRIVPGIPKERHVVKVKAAVLNEVGAVRPYRDSEPISVREVSLASPGSGEVLVRMESAGVCHSDLSRVSGVRDCRTPMVLGHEGCGIVEEVGQDVRDVKVGDKVTMTFMPRCGECPSCQAPGWSLCERGVAANAAGTMLAGGRRLSSNGVALDHHGGVSAFAEYAVVDAHSVVVIPAEIPSPVGALLGCAVLTGGGALINAGRATAGQRVAVVGLGGVGLAAALVARAIDAATVTAIDTNMAKLAAASEFGADDAYTPDEALDAGLRFDIVVECVGHPLALESAVKLTAVGGTTVTVGLAGRGSTLNVDMLSLVIEARSIVGSYMGSGIPKGDIGRYVGMYLDGRLPIEKLITGHTSLEGINRAMDRLDEGLEIRQIVDLDPAASTEDRTLTAGRRP